MKIAILSGATGGGAGIAAQRLVSALNENLDVKAEFINIGAIGEPVPQDVAPTVSFSNRILTNTQFTVEYPGHVRGWLVDLLAQYDLLNVHWSTYLLSIAELDELSRRGIPMLFTLHDYYYITGGCHYPAGCERFLDVCGSCPQVDGDACNSAFVPVNQKIKRRIFARPNVHLSAPSEYLVNQALAAGMVPPERAHVLRNPYKPVVEIKPEQQAAPIRIVLVADLLTESRKGMRLAVEALSEASRRLLDMGQPGFVVDVVGKARSGLDMYLAEADFRYEQHGHIQDHGELARIYSKANYLLSCSYDDNWPNTLVEAGAYGCIPIVGPGHGCEEFVTKFRCGYVSNFYSPDAFAETILCAVQNSALLDETYALSKDVVRFHDPKLIAGIYKKQIIEFSNKRSLINAAGV